MRRLAAALVCVGMLEACGGVPPRTHPVPDARRLAADFGQAWGAVLHILAERGYELQRIDQTTGVIETGWAPQNPEYTASVLVTQNEDRYSDCGKPPVGERFQGKQVRLSAVLAPVRRGETSLRFEVAFRTQRQGVWPWSADRADFSECHSKGRLEDELAVEVQLKAFAEQLDRVRRGTR